MGEERQGEERQSQERQSHDAVDEPGPDESAEPTKVWDDLPPEVEYALTPEEEIEAAQPRREAWRKRSATGALLTSFAFGLREVLEPDRNEPAIMMETSGVPPKDLPVEADLENVLPRESVVKIRPWLLPGGATAVPDEDAATVSGRSRDPEDA